jgi:hypothetical protein
MCALAIKHEIVSGHSPSAALGLAVATLLPPVLEYRIAAVVPDHSSRAKPQRLTALPQPPADIAVVAGSTKPRIEPAYLFEVRYTEGHVAARDVLRLSIGEEDMGGIARRLADALGDRPVVGMRDVRAAHPAVFCAQEGSGQVSQPVGVGHRRRDRLQFRRCLLSCRRCERCLNQGSRS